MLHVRKYCNNVQSLDKKERKKKKENRRISTKERSQFLRMDHLISELDTYFDLSNDAVMSFFLYILSALLVSWEGNPVQAAL